MNKSAEHTSLIGESIEDQERRLAWFRRDKFGLFIHWGPCSIIGVDLSWGREAPRPFDITDDKVRGVDPRYDNLYKEFDPVEYDAAEWVRIAKNAGMKYLVFTAKHHDGFSNYHTEYSDYNIANTPFKRDIVKELADACHAADFKFGIYYSPRDWYHPDYLIGDNSKYRHFMQNQIRELLTKYGKVDVLWFDSYGTTDINDAKVYDELWKPYELLEMIHHLQPGIIVNNRLAILGSYDHPSNPDLWCDYSTPEERIGAFQYGRAWESCMTLVGGQWGYKPGGEMYTREQCIKMLASTVCGDGNLLLNTGPMPTGKIEPRQAERLAEMGEWLKTYGEGIYGARGGPFKPGEWGGSTRKGDTVYVHVWNWGDGAIKLPAIEANIKSAELMGGGKIDFRQDEGGITLNAAESDRTDPVTVVKLTLDKSAMDMEAV